MSNSAHLQLPYLAAAQAQKHVSVNDALSVLDAIVQLAVIDQDLAQPPVSPIEGDRYIVGTAATGAWATYDGQITSYNSGAWQFYPPVSGWRVWVADEEKQYVFKNTTWQDLSFSSSPSGATTELHVIEEELSLLGATVDSTIVIPDRAVVFGVSTRTTQAVTGATSYDCGIVGEVAKFGATLSILTNATNSGVIGPTAFYADTPVRLTANGGNFTGGNVRIAIHYVLCGVPQQ
jgi:Protein of unknown function (DUF2793)